MKVLLPLLGLIGLFCFAVPLHVALHVEYWTAFFLLGLGVVMGAGAGLAARIVSGDGEDVL